MWLTVLVTIVLVVVVFGFVLEPILRGRSDHVEPDTVTIPDAVDAVELSEPYPAPPTRADPLPDAPQAEYATEVGRVEPGS